MARAPPARGRGKLSGGRTLGSVRSWLCLLFGWARAALERSIAFVVEAARGGREQARGIERGLRRALPAAQHVAERVADDHVGDLDRALGQLEPPDHAVAAGGQEVAGRELVAGLVVEGLAGDADLEVELAAGAARLRGQAAPRQDAAAALEVRRDQV